jgi:hypothetical protein
MTTVTTFPPVRTLRPISSVPDDDPPLTAAELADLYARSADDLAGQLEDAVNANKVTPAVVAAILAGLGELHAELDQLAHRLTTSTESSSTPPPPAQLPAPRRSRRRQPQPNPHA